MALWMFVVYFPLAHMVWGADWLYEWRLERGAADQGASTSRAAPWCT